MELHNILSKTGNKHYFLNKAGKYLAPSLLLYGDEFMSNFLSLEVMSYGLDDKSIPQTEAYVRPLFVLCKVNRPYSNALNYFQRFHGYITDYYFGAVESTQYVMLVLKLPEEVEESYHNFLLGNFSKLYTAEQRLVLFAKNENKALDVIMRTSTGAEFFKEMIDNFYNTKVTDDDIIDAEFDLPLDMEAEVFNFNLNFTTDEKLPNRSNI